MNEIAEMVEIFDQHGILCVYVYNKYPALWGSGFVSLSDRPNTRPPAPPLQNSKWNSKFINRWSKIVHLSYNIPGVANRQSPNLQSMPSAHRKRLFSSTAAEPGKNMLSTAISSLFSLALRIRSSPTVFVLKFNRDENSDDSIAIVSCHELIIRIRSTFRFYLITNRLCLFLFFFCFFSLSFARSFRCARISLPFSLCFRFFYTYVSRLTSLKF